MLNEDGTIDNRACAGSLSKGTKIAFVTVRDRNINAVVVSHIGVFTKVRDAFTNELFKIPSHMIVVVVEETKRNVI